MKPMLPRSVTSPGVYDIPDAQYHADDVCPMPSLNSGVAKIHAQAAAGEKSDRHAWQEHPRLNPNHKPVNKDIYDSGRLRHALMLGQPHLVKIVEGYDDWKKPAARDIRDDIRNAGLTPALAHKFAEAEAMVRAARAQIAIHQDFPASFTNGRPEQTLVWFEGDGDNRIACRARLDWLHDGGNVFPDLKTTDASAGEEWSKRTLYSTGADIQESFYRRGIKAVLEIERPIFTFCVVETYAPYALMFHTPTAEAQAAADAKVDAAIQRWRWCMKHNAWPGYPRRAHWYSPPPWEAAKAEEIKHGPSADEADAKAALEVWKDWQKPVERSA